MKKRNQCVKQIAKKKKKKKKKLENEEEVENKRFYIDGDRLNSWNIWTIILEIYFRAQKKYKMKICLLFTTA